MEKLEQIIIKISGFKGNIKLTPDNFDIKEVTELIEQTEKLLFPNDRKNRPLISYRVEEGSIKNIFKTSVQTVIGFSAVLMQVQATKQIDFLETNSAKAIETLQKNSVEKGYSFEISTSLKDSPKVYIDKNTFYFRTEEEWVDAEFYFYGKITNAGGKEKANIHLFNQEYGTLYIATPQEFLAKAEKNILYKQFGIRAKGKQNTITGEIDKNSLQFLELLDYESAYNEKYLKQLRKKSAKWLINTNPDKFMDELRGYDA